MDRLPTGIPAQVAGSRPLFQDLPSALLEELPKKRKMEETMTDSVTEMLNLHKNHNEREELLFKLSERNVDAQERIAVALEKIANLIR